MNIQPLASLALPPVHIVAPLYRVIEEESGVSVQLLNENGYSLVACISAERCKNNPTLVRTITRALEETFTPEKRSYTSLKTHEENYRIAMALKATNHWKVWRQIKTFYGIVDMNV